MTSLIHLNLSFKFCQTVLQSSCSYRLKTAYFTFVMKYPIVSRIANYNPGCKTQAEIHIAVWNSKIWCQEWRTYLSRRKKKKKFIRRIIHFKEEKNRLMEILYKLARGIKEADILGLVKSCMLMPKYLCQKKKKKIYLHPLIYH